MTPWIANLVHEITGRWMPAFGQHVPPGDWIDHVIEDDPVYGILHVQTKNDGHDLWIGTGNAWLFNCHDRQARQIAWFVLYHWWARGTWFGLRRRLWFWALGVRMDAHRRSMDHPR